MVAQAELVADMRPCTETGTAMQAAPVLARGTWPDFLRECVIRCASGPPLLDQCLAPLQQDQPPR